MKKLRQKNLFTFKEFEILDKGLLIKSKQINNYLEWITSYNEITKEVWVQKVGGNEFFSVAGICALSVIIIFITKLVGGKIETIGNDGEFIWIVISIISCFIPILTTKRYKLLMCTDDKGIDFLYSENQKKEVDEFIQNIIKERDTYFKNKYAKIDMTFSKEENLNRIEWLKNEEIITESEYSELRKELSNYEKENRNQVGFQ